MAKVLVTGGSGFIGTHLVAALAARGDEVTCLVRNSSRVDPLQKAGARLVYGDVTDPESLAAAVADQGVVFHLAGRTQSLVPRRFYEVNRQGVANVVRACAARTSPPVMVSVSSLAAAGPAADGQPKTEADRMAPISHYGHSKRAGERAAAAFADRVPITIVRPPIVLGQGDRMGLPLFGSIARFGVHMSPGLRSRRYSLVHVADLVPLLLLAAERGRRLPPREPAGPGVPPRGTSSAGRPNPQGIYFAACEQDPTYADLGRMVCKALGRRRVLVIPAATPLVWTVARAGQAISRFRREPLFMNLDKAREITAGNWLCSARAAAEQLGFAVAAPLPDRLRETAQWYRQEGWL